MSVVNELHAGTGRWCRASAVIGRLLLDRDATGDATRTEDAFAAFDVLLQAHPSRVAEDARPVAVTA